MPLFAASLSVAKKAKVIAQAQNAEFGRFDASEPTF